MAEVLQFTAGGTPIRLYAQESQHVEGGSTKRAPAIVFLHGAGGHVDFWVDRLAPLLKEARIALFAPHYFDRTHTDRADLNTISDGVHVPQWLDTIAATLTFVAARPTVDPERIVLAGTSLGGFLALAFAAQLSAATSTQPFRLRALLEISGGLAAPYDAMATARMPPTLILHGAADKVVPVSWAQELDARLTELGVDHRTEILPGEGHWFSAAALPRMLLAASSFLQGQLS